MFATFIASLFSYTHLAGDVGAYMVHLLHFFAAQPYLLFPVFGVLTFTDVNNAGQIVKGAGQLWLPAQTVNGADAALSQANYVGLTETGIDFHYNRKVTVVETDQYLAGVMGFPAQETVTFAFEAVQLNLATMKLLWGTGDETLVGGTSSDVSSSLTGGQQVKQLYYQLVWKGEAPAPSTNLQRVFQAWRCMVTSIGDIKFTKNKEASAKITLTALIDIGAIGAGKAPLYQILDS